MLLLRVSTVLLLAGWLWIFANVAGAAAAWWSTPWIIEAMFAAGGILAWFAMRRSHGRYLRRQALGAALLNFLSFTVWVWLR